VPPFARGEVPAEIAALCGHQDRPSGQAAHDVDLTKTAVRARADQAGPDAETRGDGRLTRADRRELAQLRRENRRLREDVEILKRATAILATASRRTRPFTQAETAGSATPPRQPRRRNGRASAPPAGT
jgi:transposase